MGDALSVPFIVSCLNRVLACKMDDSEFEFDYHLNIRFNPFQPFSFVACC